jgi:hypothetical protein
MNSESNRRTLSLGGGKYILASRMRADGEVSDEVLTRAGRYHLVKDNLRVKEVYVGDGERRQRYVVCHNPSEGASAARPTREAPGAPARGARGVERRRAVLVAERARDRPGAEKPGNTTPALDLRGFAGKSRATCAYCHPQSIKLGQEVA